MYLVNVNPLTERSYYMFARICIDQDLSYFFYETNPRYLNIDMTNFFKKQNFEGNTGFGTSASAQGTRLLKKDGSYNVIQRGLTLGSRLNIYHDLINMSWRNFVLLIFGGYTFLNILFAFAFLAAGMDQIEGHKGLTGVDHFWDAFFFSSQTLTTVGYGHSSPIGFMANVIASIESLVGLMAFALITGLLFARFSRPNAKLLYSHVALIAPYREGLNAVMVRIANGRRNQLIECEVQLMLSFIEPETNQRRFLSLDLEYKKVTGLPLNWTVVHPINSESPLYMRNREQFDLMDAEFILIFKAFDDTYSQTVYSRNSYTGDELVWGAKFKPMYHRSHDGQGTILEMSKIGEYENAELFQAGMKALA